MKVTAVRLAQFRIPFVQPYVTAAGTAEAREGVIVRLETDAGVTGLGESSLLPHEGGAAAIFDELSRDAGRLAGLEVRGVLDSTPASPVWAGVETAAWDADAKGDAKPLSGWMWANAATIVPVNALVTAPGAEDAAAAAVDAVRRGFGSVKLKVGITGDAAAETARIRRVHSALKGAARLRLDANGAWDRETAIEVLKALDGLDIEYIEQPVAAGNLDAMRRIRSLSPVPVAADEDVTSALTARDVFDGAAADVVVLKPITLGGLQATYSIRRQAMRSGIESTITTSIDTGIGTALALHVAAGTESRYAAGLATAHLLQSDLLKHPLRIENGSMLVPDAPGLGVDLDEEALARYTIRSWESGT